LNLYQGITEFFKYDFLFNALIGTIFLSLSCGVISPFIISKRYAFMGTAVSHSTLLGLAISLSLFGVHEDFKIFLTTMLVTLMLVFFLAKATYLQRLPSDSLIGLFFTGSMGLGIIIYHFFGKQQADLMGYLFGDILLLGAEDLILSGTILLILLLALIAPFKKWIYMIYDEQGAIIQGLPVKLYHYLFFMLLSFLIVSSLKIAGAILVNTLLLVPGVFGLRFGRNIREVIAISTVFSLLSAVTGLYLANLKSFPSGATMAVTQLILFVAFSLMKKLKRSY
jgi:ABC-type Mn2+/Zn2+ transport system permease subunit